MRNIVILNSLHFSYPLPILMRVSYNTLIVKQNTSDYYKYNNNYEGLMEELQRQKVTVIKEINAILRLTDFGKLKGKIWKILYDINNSPQMKARIVMPGKYILKLLQN